jgi:acetolactate synthase-1/2/3 large subunit
VPDAVHDGGVRPGTVAHGVAQFIARMGIERVFSLPGGHMKPLWDELRAAGIRIVAARHEVAAVHMAQAEADLRGRPAVAVVTTGPGLTNAVTGIACGYLAQSPVLVISTRPPLAQSGMGALEEVDQAAIVRPVCRGVEVIDHPRHVMARLDQALSAALGDDGLPGPAYVEFPCDLLREPLATRDGDDGRVVAGSRRRAPRPPAAEAVSAAAELIRSARRPLVISGRGGVEDPDAVARFIAATGALYLDTRSSRGVLSDRIGTYVPAVRARAMAQADVVVTLGRALDFELAYGSPAIFRHARFVRIGRTFEETAGNRRADAEVRGDVGATLDLLAQADCAPARPDRIWLEQMVWENGKRVERFAQRMREEPAGDDGRMHPNTLLAAVNEWIDDDTIVIVDGGDILSFARTALRTPTYLDLGAFGCLGVGTPFGVAAALNFPARRVIAVVGDGAFGFNAMELETAVREQAGLVVVIANNRAFNIERYDQVANYGGRVVGTELSDCAFADLARALGAYGERVERPEDLQAALGRAMENAPAVLDVAVTRDAVSADSRSGLALVPQFQALGGWDLAERKWNADQQREKRCIMPVTVHQPLEREAPRGYSEATSGGGIVAVSGQLPADDLLEREAPFDEQFVSALTRFIDTVEASGATAAEILLMRVYVTSIDEYKGALRSFGGAYRDAFSGHYPATTLVEVSGLIDERAMVEIEGLAVQPA